MAPNRRAPPSRPSSTQMATTMVIAPAASRALTNQGRAAHHQRGDDQDDAGRPFGDGDHADPGHAGGGRAGPGILVQPGQRTAADHQHSGHPEQPQCDQPGRLTEPVGQRVREARPTGSIAT